MRVRDFALLVLVCIVWAFNNVLSKLVVGHWHVPPIFFAGIRFVVVAIVTLPWLLPAPKDIVRLIAVALLMGAISFALIFAGLRTTAPSVAAVYIQSGVPFTILLSMIILGERIHLLRGLGVALTVVGIVIVAWGPDVGQLSLGMLLIIASAFATSLGSVLMKQLDGVEPLRFQAWVGFLSFMPLLATSALFEDGQWSSVVAVGWAFLPALAYAALVVSVFAHTAFFWLIRRYEANLIAPLTLMNPLFTFGLGAVFTGDRFDARMISGSALALVGVLIVAMRPRHTTKLLIEREQG